VLTRPAWLVLGKRRMAEVEIYTNVAL